MTRQMAPKRQRRWQGELFSDVYRALDDALEEEECLASTSKHCTKYLHLQEPAELAMLLEVVPEDADTENPDKYVLKWHNQPKHHKEVTFRVQGYLVDFHLPPILQLDQLPQNVAWAKQMVRISGLGSRGFEQSVMGFKTIHEIMTRRFPTNSCQSWQPTEFEGHAALDLQSPYFTRKSKEKLTEFPPNVDPLGHLARRGKSKGLWPSLDALVEYYEIKVIISDEKQMVCHKHTNPATLRRGYLVEVTVVFHLNRTKKGRWMLFTLVRAIEVLNREVDKAYLSWTLSEVRRPVPPRKIASKRNQEYEEKEEIEGPRRRLESVVLSDIGASGRMANGAFIEADIMMREK
ncbi:hypothetical protein K439DRAFT_1622734 [Ramaria rubella]|nr:hypothetical protein K439DRAFT_1622734 [Ramaria rubella]